MRRSRRGALATHAAASPSAEVAASMGDDHQRPRHFATLWQLLLSRGWKVLPAGDVFSNWHYVTAGAVAKAKKERTHGADFFRSAAVLFFM